MTPENNNDQHPEAQRESELVWIDQNTPLFFTKASGYFGLVGRGAIIVDAAARRLGEGTLFTYFSEEQMEHLVDEEFREMVDGYDPTKEFVVLLLPPKEETRAYRVGIPDEQDLVISSIKGSSYARA